MTFFFFSWYVYVEILWISFRLDSIGNRQQIFLLTLLLLLVKVDHPFIPTLHPHPTPIYASLFSLLHSTIFIPLAHSSRIFVPYNSSLFKLTTDPQSTLLLYFCLFYTTSSSSCITIVIIIMQTTSSITLRAKFSLLRGRFF